MPRITIVTLLAVAGIAVPAVTAGCIDLRTEDAATPESPSFLPQGLLIDGSYPASATSDDGLFSILVEARSVSGPVRLQHQQREGPIPTLPAGYRLASTVIELTATSVDGAVVTLNKPLSITFLIGDSDLRLAEDDPSRFVVQRYEGSAIGWYPLATVIEPDHRLATAKTGTLGLFVLTVTNMIGQSAQPANEPAAPTPGPASQSREPTASPRPPTIRPSAASPVPAPSPTPTLAPTSSPVPVPSPTAIRKPAVSLVPTRAVVVTMPAPVPADSAAVLAPTPNSVPTPSPTPTPPPTPAPTPPPTPAPRPTDQ